MAFDPTIQQQTEANAKLVSQALGQVVKNAQDGLGAFGQEFVNQMKSTLSHEGSGVQYPSLPNRSSAPGEAPARQSGDYGDSWDYAVGQESNGVFFVDVGSPDEIGPYLEYGTQDMEPRPHLRPMVDRQKGQLAVRLVQNTEGGESQVIGKAKDIFDDLVGGV